MKIRVKASHARATRTGVIAGVDVDVSVFVDGQPFPDGEVTLVRSQNDWEGYGSHPSHWVSGALLAAIPEDERCKPILDAIEAKAAEVAAAQVYGYAVLGDDGTRPVVWGKGHTEIEARQDAADQDGYDDADVLVAITHEQNERIEQGDVSAP